MEIFESTFSLLNTSYDDYIDYNLTSPANEYKNYFVIPLVAFIVCGLTGNTLVCVAILIEKRLQNMTNCFLFSMAVADLTVCSLVMPLSFLNEIHDGRWVYSLNLCYLYIVLDVFLCSVSIVHMSVIALDRYRGISRPFSSRKKSKSNVVMKIAGVWLCTLVLASPIAVLANQNPENILQGHMCQIFSVAFVIYGTVMMFVIPFVIMAFAYAATVRLLKQKAAMYADEESDVVRKKESLSIRRSQTSAEKKRSIRYRRTVSNASALHRRERAYKSSLASLMEMHVRNRSSLPSSPTRHNSSPLKSALKTNLHKAKKYLKHRRLETFTAVANEQKATKVLGIVFCTFFVCWVPFFSANFILGVCGESCTRAFPKALGSVLLWLGYLSSTINPVIYTVFNKVFRATFKRILRCRCRRDHRELSTNSEIPMYSRDERICEASFYPSPRVTRVNEIRRASIAGEESSEPDIPYSSKQKRNSTDFLEVPAPVYIVDSSLSN